MKVEIRPLDVADPADVEAALGIYNRAVVQDVPDLPVATKQQFEGELHHPWPGIHYDRWLAYLDGVAAGVLKIARPTLDNLHAADVDVVVDPAYRRRGIGRALYDFAVEFCRANERRTLQGAYVVALPGGPSRSDGHRVFAEKMGVKSALPEVRRRLDVTSADRSEWSALIAEARQRAAGYSVVAWTDAVPEEIVADLAALDSRFFAEAPLGDLDLEPQNVDVTRVRAGEETHHNRGNRNYHVAARHDETGALAAWTHICFEAGRVEHAWQEITIVDRAHRGHRLGMLVKMENLLRTLEAEPDLRYLDTWNAAENTHMIAINEAMGYRPVDGWVNWQSVI
ncbi:MAG TPA: GNAT family N-acetyltransferase [Micromonosporaceae bacterium]|nr:GNAT family N-acetyltransferase [Micromonosporaceae bacterium]